MIYICVWILESEERVRGSIGNHWSLAQNSCAVQILA